MKPLQGFSFVALQITPSTGKLSKESNKIGERKASGEYAILVKLKLVEE